MGVEESAHEPEGLADVEGCGEGAHEFLLGNVEADTGLVWFGVFYVDVVFWEGLHTNQMANHLF